MTHGSQDSASAKGRRPSISETFGLDSYRLTKGKWLLLAVAGCMMVLGLLLSLGASSSSARSEKMAAASQGTGGADSGMSAFNSFAESSQAPRPTASEPAAGAEDSGLSAFSPFLVKGGFGLFIGFAIGFAIRAFIRLAFVLVGFYLLTLILMSYAGWVEIHWTVMESQFNASVTNLSAQFASLKAFLNGAIPSLSMSGAGLFIGLRKR